MSILKRIRYFLRFNNKLAILFCLALFSQIVGFIPSIPAVLLYSIYILFAIYTMTKSKRKSFAVVIFLSYIPLEIFLADPDPLFRSWERYFLFLFLMMGVSPVFQSEKVRKMRNTIFVIFLRLCTILSIGSFFAYFMGINLMRRGEHEILDNVAGYFGGLVVHSMILGPICGISAVYMLTLALKTKRKVFWLLMACCIICCMFTASRSSLLASIVGCLAALYHLTNSVGRFIKMSIMAAIIAMLSSSFWLPAMNRIIQKNQGTMELSIDSREPMWLERIEEFKSSPIFGIGFVSMDVNSHHGIDFRTGTIEPGSSWLAVLSMTGIIGFLLVSIVFCSSFGAVWRNRCDDKSAIISGLLALFFIHMFAEGYIFSGGSFMCFALWLCVGVAYDQRYKKLPV